MKKWRNEGGNRRVSLTGAGAGHTRLLRSFDGILVVFLKCLSAAGEEGWGLRGARMIPECLAHRDGEQCATRGRSQECGQAYWHMTQRNSQAGGGFQMGGVPDIPLLFSGLVEQDVPRLRVFGNVGGQTVELLDGLGIDFLYNVIVEE